MKCSLNVKTNKVGEIPGHLLTLDILDSHPWQLITIYAPNDSAACAIFSQMCGFVSERTMLEGDFNSVTSPSDHLSGNLNGTSSILKQELSIHGFEEISGSHLRVFIYHYPSLSSQKS